MISQRESACLRHRNGAWARVSTVISLYSPPLCVLTLALGWLPLGPCLVSSAVLPLEQAQDTVLRTTRDTKHAVKHSSHQNPLQNGSTKDQLWKIAETVAALSYGTTLKVGDIICTGTPAGQGSAKQPEPLWLQDGDNITVSGEAGLGSLVNPVVWEKGGSKQALRAKL